MVSVRTKDTAAEVVLRSELHRRGLRFRKHVKDLPGKPDVVFSRAKMVVFIDGDFWHGRNFADWEERLSPFWQTKIARNIERDRSNDRSLVEIGWLVVRIWERDIRRNADSIADQIKDSWRLRVGLDTN